MRSGIKTAGCILFFAAAASMTGCTQRIGDFTIISSKNVNVSANRGDRVKGESCVYIILGIPTGVPDLKSAVDKGALPRLFAREFSTSFGEKHLAAFLLQKRFADSKYHILKKLGLHKLVG